MTVKVTNNLTGDLYYLSDDKYNSEKNHWTLVEELLVDTKEEELRPLKEIKNELIALGVKFKGNASRESLETLLELSKEEL